MSRFSGRLDTRRQIARIVPAEAGLTQRAEQVLQRFESQEVQRFIGDFEFDFPLRTVAAAAACPGLLARLLHRDVAFVDQLLDQIVEQLLHLLGGESLQLLHHLLELLVAEHLPTFEGLLDGALQLLERMLVELAEAHALGVEAALQEIVG